MGANTSHNTLHPATRCIGYTIVSLSTLVLRIEIRACSESFQCSLVVVHNSFVKSEMKKSGMERRQHTKALTLHQHLPRPLQLSVRGLLVLKALNEEYRVNIFWSPFIAHTKLRCDTTNSTAELATEEHHHIISMSSPYQPSVCKCDDKHTCTSAPLVVTQVSICARPLLQRQSSHHTHAYKTHKASHRLGHGLHPGTAATLAHCT